MNNGDKITKRQLMALMFVCMLSPTIRLLPLRAVQTSGKSAWLAAPVALAVGILYVYMMEYLTKNRGDDEGLSELIIRALGNTAGRIVLGIFSVWFILYCGFVLRVSSERMLSSVYVNGNSAMFILLTLFVSFIAARGKIKSLARTGQVFATIIIFMLAAVIVFSIKDVKKEYLLPVTYMDTGKILIAALPIIDILGGYAYFLFLDDHTIKQGHDLKTAIKWVSLLGVVIFMIVFVTIGNLSAQIVVKNTSPFFIMIRNIVIFGIVERIEAVVIALWVLCDFLYIAALLVICKKLSGKVTGVKKVNKLLWPITAAVCVIAFFISKSVFQLRIYSEWIAPIGNTFLSFAVIPIILLIGRIRKKI